MSETLSNQRETTYTTSEKKINTWWMITFFILAVVSLAISIFIGEPGVSQEFHLRLIIAISIAGIASIIPGFFDISVVWLRNSIKAGGAIGIFVLIYLINPATLHADFRPKVNLTGNWQFYLQTAEGDIPSGYANIEHKEGRNIFNVIGNVEANPHAPIGRYHTPRLTFESNFGLITDRKIIFHYVTNLGEEGVAIADYTLASAEELYFNFNDYSGKDKDGVPIGVLKFVLIKS